MIIFLLSTVFGWSLAPTSMAEPSMDNSVEIAKNRSYAGGADEEVLRVQIAMNPPQRRMDAKAIQGQVLKNSGRVEMTEEGPTSAPAAE